MARDLTAGALAELSAPTIRPVLFVEVEFDSGFVRLWTGIGDITWDSKLWTGMGNLLSVAPAGETTEIRANGIVISLSGVNPVFLSAVLANARQSKPANCWLGFLNASEAVIADPYQFFSGSVDVPTINEGAESAIITITAENRLIILRKILPRRYTSEDQKIDFPTDKGFDFQVFIQNWTGQWGTGFFIPTFASRPRRQRDDDDDD